MTAQNSETLINEMGLALKKVEARLENSEEKQNTTAQRLDELYKALLERLWSLCGRSTAVVKCPLSVKTAPPVTSWRGS